MSASTNGKATSLTIGMAAFDDFDGVYFTVTSLLNHHADAMGDCRILVIDNNPSSRQGRATRDWVAKLSPHAEYHPFETVIGTARARDEVFCRAQSRAVLCLDCHVLLVPGAVRRLLDYYDAHPHSRDLLTGPLLTDTGLIAATHQDPRWSSGAWGVWANDDRAHDPEADPFPIWQQGMGLFSCITENWVGFHPEFRGFGGCESYIMEKFRRKGGQVLCCPWLRWTHRFARPAGVPYKVSRDDSLRNYLIGFKELGTDAAPALEHYQKLRSRNRTPADPKPVRQSPPSTSRFAVAGDPGLGAVRMRGESLARHLGCELLGPGAVAGTSRRDTIVLVKKGAGAAKARERCDHLVYDPLDAFCDDPLDTDAADFWRERHRELAFDDIIATSPACLAIMRGALPERVRVHLSPHHADPRIHEGWADRNGPVVYVGLHHFIDPGMERIRQACALIGKEFVVASDFHALRGASLALALRLPPYDSPLNRCCKPQVKIANALAGGLAVVATDCPAATSLYPDVPTVPVDFSARQLADAMSRALAGKRVGKHYHLGDHLAAMDRILGEKALVIYTAIFGGYDVLRDPEERVPGVQYVCFTDNPRLRSDSWIIRYRRPSGNPLMQSKACKILAHETLDCDYSLWIDGRSTLHCLNGAFDRLRSDLGLRRHPSRDCIYDEAEHCKRQRRGDPRLIDTSVARYRAGGHPERHGLWLGGVLLRRHTPAIAEFNRQWWREVSTGSSRDQISLPVVLRRLGLAFDELPADAPRLRIGSHAR
jgi:Protein of unknown function (DUF616)/Glycosyl transferase family 2